MLDLKKLFYFQLAARYPSLRQAAHQLGITQPVLTRHIQDLEEELGTVLLQRRATGNKLTEAGQLLVARSEQLLEYAAATQGAIDDLRSHPAGIVTLAAPATFNMGYLPALLGLIRSQLPGVHLRVMEGSARHIEEWLITRQADVGIVVHPAGSTQLLEDRILTEELYLIGRRKIQEGGTIPLAQICRLPLVLPLSPHGTRRLLERIAAQQKLAFLPVLEVDSPNTIRMLVASGELYTVHSLLAFGNDIEEERVFATRIAPAPIRSLAVATLRGEPLTSAARALAHHIRKLVTGTVSEPTTRSSQTPRR